MSAKYGFYFFGLAMAACLSRESPNELVPAGAGGEAGGATHLPEHRWTECQAGDQAWVRRSIFSLTGRRPWGQTEVNAYVDFIAAAREADRIAAEPSGESLDPAREGAARIMMRDASFRRRWADFFMDALRVTRVETKSFETCYGSPNVPFSDTGKLAAWVRDHDVFETNPPVPEFTMHELLDSAIEIDDVSPLYRAHLMTLISRPYAAANVGPLELERARRQNFGATFERAYLHRDRVCLSCHNSEYAVTFDDDPVQNRHWAIPGLFERALYGASNALHPPEEAAVKGSDELRAISMFRYDGVFDVNGLSPYGWNGEACGKLRIPVDNDPLDVDTFFGSIRSTPDDPNRGRRASVWDLEQALHRGLDQIAEHGLVRLSGDVIEDPDEALAYLVAQNIVDQVWAEIMGQRLTIATYFSRTEIQRDILRKLTDHFVASHYSLRTLLLDILAHPLFNLKSPEEGCGTSAYELPRILNAWSNAEQDPTMRQNSPGDGVFAISARPLRRGLHKALEWPEYPEYPMGTERVFQASIGFFLKDGEPGFRGLDFQGRLSWEATYGACKSQAANDYIAKINQLAKNTPGATLGDVIIAIKDRLIGEPWIEPTQEKPLLEDLLGSSLEDQTWSALDVRSRMYCGVLVSSPQFMLGGVVPRDTDQSSRLILPEVAYDKICTQMRVSALMLAVPYEIHCDGGKVNVSK